MCAALALGWGSAAQVYVLNGLQYVSPEQFSRENGATYKNQYGTLTLKWPKGELVMYTGSREAQLNGKPMLLSAPLANIQDTVVAPLADLQRAFGLAVTAPPPKAPAPQATNPPPRATPTPAPPSSAWQKVLKGPARVGDVIVQYRPNESKGGDNLFRSATVFDWPTALPTSVETLINFCYISVKSSLKAPATAQFSDGFLQIYRDQTWTMVGSVDAQNSYGALIRSSFVCMHKFANGKLYTLVSIQ